MKSKFTRIRYEDPFHISRIEKLNRLVEEVLQEFNKSIKTYSCKCGWSGSKEEMVVVDNSLICGCPQCNK